MDVQRKANDGQRARPLRHQPRDHQHGTHDSEIAVVPKAKYQYTRYFVFALRKIYMAYNETYKGDEMKKYVIATHM